MWSGALKEDWRAYVQVHRARTWRAKGLLAFQSPSFAALAFYRWGRRTQTGNSRWLRRAGQLMYGLGQPWVTRLTKVSLPLGAQIGPGAWLAPNQPLVIAPGTQVGPGARFFGGNTLGIGGRPGARGVPMLGSHVVLAPGATVVGPVEIPNDAVIGPNSVVTKSPSPPQGGARLRLLGVPARSVPHAIEAWLPRLGPSLNSVKTMNAPEPLWKSFQADLKRYYVYHPDAGVVRKWRIALEVDGLLALAVYRFGRRLKTTSESVLSRIGLGFHAVASSGVRWMTGIHLDVDAKIEPGLYIGHSGSIYVGPGVSIGANCSLSQMCCVAAGGPGDKEGAPVLGERVYVGAGCKVMGGVVVGNGAALGANAVVTTDVPEDSVMVGVPARSVSQQGSRDFIVLTR